MFRRVGYFFSDLWHWLATHLRGRRLLLGLGGLVVIGAVGVGVYLLVTEVINEDEAPPAPAPRVVIEQPPAEDTEAQDLGFPEFATKNTTRVAGADTIADAAGVALAVFPSTGGLEGPPAVALVDEDDWASGVAAASLTAAPVGAPTLATSGDDVPDLTAAALKALAPRGSAETGDKQVFRIGGAADAEGLRTEEVAGENPAEVAAGVDKLRGELTGDEPEHLLLVSSDDPPFAMPAAAWAARSGDPVLFVQHNSVPKPTLDALKRHEDTPVYVLGPESVVSGKAFDQVLKAAPGAKRVGASDPVENAIEFARYTDGSFGWNINDPGHGFVLAATDRPADAAAAAALSGSGTWGPLLLTDDPVELPAPLRGYLLDLKPGYVDDPTRAFYNHVWLIGDQDAISVGMQAQVDQLAELARVKSGSGGSVLGPPPGTADSEAPADAGGSGQQKP